MSVRHFNPRNSRTTNEELSLFLSRSVTENLDDVPGIGKRIIQFLAEPSDVYSFKPVCNTYQLFGKFLSFKEPGVTPTLHCERFYQWLLEKGVRTNTTEIVEAIAEKTATWMPVVYDG